MRYIGRICLFSSRSCIKFHGDYAQEARNRQTCNGHPLNSVLLSTFSCTFFLKHFMFRVWSSFFPFLLHSPIIVTSCLFLLRYICHSRRCCSFNISVGALYCVFQLMIDLLLFWGCFPGSSGLCVFFIILFLLSHIHWLFVHSYLFDVFVSLPVE